MQIKFGVQRVPAPCGALQTVACGLHLPGSAAAGLIEHYGVHARQGNGHRPVSIISGRALQGQFEPERRMWRQPHPIERIDGAKFIPCRHAVDGGLRTFIQQRRHGVSDFESCHAVAQGNYTGRGAALGECQYRQAKESRNPATHASHSQQTAAVKAISRR